MTNDAKKPTIWKRVTDALDTAGDLLAWARWRRSPGPGKQDADFPPPGPRNKPPTPRKD